MEQKFILNAVLWGRNHFFWLPLWLWLCGAEKSEFGSGYGSSSYITNISFFAPTHSKESQHAVPVIKFGWFLMLFTAPNTCTLVLGVSMYSYRLYTAGATSRGMYHEVDFFEGEQKKTNTF
jgi:hypothetical protein